MIATTAHGHGPAGPPPSPASPSPDRLVSLRIDLLRLLLIVGIMVIHIPFGRQDNPYADPGAFDWLVLYLREGVFRAGVPCLSAVSGWLLARGAGQGYATLVRRKARTLMIPYLGFNLATFAMVLALQTAGLGSHWKPIAEADGAALLDMLFGLSAPPINIALYFLRDMMLCVLLSPILFWGARKHPLAAPAALVLFALFESHAAMPDAVQFLFIRPDIPLFFYAGIAMAVQARDVTRLDRHAGPALLGCLLGGAAVLSVKLPGANLSPMVEQAVLLTAKMAISLSIWILSARLVRTEFGQAIARQAGLSFWLFCTHVPVLRLLFTAWGRTAIPYELFYLLAVPVAIALLLPILGLMQAHLPRLTAALLGTRTPRPQDAGTGRPPIRARASVR